MIHCGCDETKLISDLAPMQAAVSIQRLCQHQPVQKYTNAVSVIRSHFRKNKRTISINDFTIKLKITTTQHVQHIKQNSAKTHASALRNANG